MKQIFLTLIFLGFLHSYEIEITSKEGSSDNKKGLITFFGDVKIKKQNDEFRADKVFVYLNEKREMKRIYAVGKTSFTLKDKKNTHFKGKANSFVYLPLKKELSLEGDALVEDLTNKRKLIGEKIVFDEKTKLATIKGKQKAPVRIIFNIPDEQ